jgi:hypothetical protein
MSIPLEHSCYSSLLQPKTTEYIEQSLSKHFRQFYILNLWVEIHTPEECEYIECLKCEKVWDFDQAHGEAGNEAGSEVFNDTVGCYVAIHQDSTMKKGYVYSISPNTPEDKLNHIHSLLKDCFHCKSCNQLRGGDEYIKDTVCNSCYSLTLRILPAGSQCAICLDPFKEDEVLPPWLLKCQHIFHRKCIRLWFLKKAICPLCRTACKGVNHIGDLTLGILN